MPCGAFSFKLDIARTADKGGKLLLGGLIERVHVGGDGRGLEFRGNRILYSREAAGAHHLFDEPYRQAALARESHQTAFLGLTHVSCLEVVRAVLGDAPQHEVCKPRSALRARPHKLHALAHRRTRLRSQIYELEGRDAQGIPDARVHAAGLIAVCVDKIVETAVARYDTQYEPHRKTCVAPLEGVHVR